MYVLNEYMYVLYMKTASCSLLYLSVKYVCVTMCLQRAVCVCVCVLMLTNTVCV